MVNVLITGGAGFIGSTLARRLLEQGNRVTCLDNLSTGSLNNFVDYQNNPLFTFIKADVNSDDLDASFREGKFNYIFHHAAVVGVKRTLEDPLSVLNDIEGIRRVLDRSAHYKIDKVIYASSSEVYGEPVEIPEREDGHVNAKLPYAVTKLMGEQYMRAYFEKGLRTTSLRFFNVYGPQQDSSPYGFVVGIFINQVLSGQSPSIFGDGSQTRDFVYIDDNINATILAMTKRETDGEAINIGTGRPSTLLDLAEHIIAICQQTGQLEPEFFPPRQFEIRHRFPDVTRMRRLLGYKPTTSLVQGLEKTIAWYKQK